VVQPPQNCLKKEKKKKERIWWVWAFGGGLATPKGQKKKKKKKKKKWVRDFLGWLNHPQGHGVAEATSRPLGVVRSPLKAQIHSLSCFFWQFGAMGVVWSPLPPLFFKNYFYFFRFKN
jgi:hypothetical protein